MRTQKLKNNTLRNMLIVLAILLLIGGFYWVGASQNTASDNNSTTKNIIEPPTKEEQKAGDEQKEKIANDDETPDKSTLPDGKKPAKVFIVDAGHYGNTVEVRAFVPGVIEAGTCTAIFINNGQEVRKTADAFIDATTTQCGKLNISRSVFPTSGEWNLTVSYTSKNYSGNSAEQKVIIK